MGSYKKANRLKTVSQNKKYAIDIVQKFPTNWETAWKIFDIFQKFKEFQQKISG